MDLKDAEQCVLVGDSGTGKTTFLHLLAGLLQLDSGKIIINENELNQFNQVQLDRFRGQNIGLIFQKSHLISALNVYDNVALAQQLAGQTEDRQLIEDLLRELDIYEKRFEKINTLSQGQAQRIAIARALINKPKLILADEPTASLDDKNAKIVAHLLIGQAERCEANLIIATHDQRVKDFFDKEIRIEKNEDVLA